MLASLLVLALALGPGCERLDEQGPPPAPGPVAPAPARPGPPVLVLTGNHVFTTTEVRAGIAADERPLVDANGSLDPDAAAYEAMLVSGFYWDRGYAKARVGSPRLDAGHHAVVISVDEGPRFTLGRLAVTGELLGTPESELAMLRCHPGDVFSRQAIGAGIGTLRTFYEDRGYAYVDVDVHTDIDLADRTLALTNEIHRGPHATFERIDVLAASPADAAAMRRALVVAAGQPFTATGLEDSRRRMLALGLRRDVAVSTRHGSTPGQVIATFEETK